MKTISCAEFAPLSRKGGIDLIDVRTPQEFFEVHAVGALLVPLANLNPDQFLESRGPRRNEPLYVICRSGGRSAQACRLFEQAGFSNVINVEGGTLAWIESGLPVNRGQMRLRPLTLEQQARIVIGLTVLLTSFLVLIHPWFLLIPAGLGLGLIVTGLSGACFTRFLLARLPWNRSENSCSPSAGCATSTDCCGGQPC
jgi:rhodanese-related sulfurtransferase